MEANLERWQKRVAEAAIAFKCLPGRVRRHRRRQRQEAGGNARGCRRGGNHNAYFGGLRMWEDGQHADTPRLAIVEQTSIEEPVYVTLPAITSGIG